VLVEDQGRSLAGKEMRYPGVLVSQAPHLQGFASRLPQTAPYVNLADVYRQQHRDQKAVATLLEGLQQTPQAADLYHALGLTRVRLGQTNDALLLLHKVAELAPDNARYAFVYAVALHDTGAPRRGIETLERMLQRQPDNGELLRVLIKLVLRTA
jgi:tetratricopeptide (TPR) repeat protein